MNEWVFYCFQEKKEKVEQRMVSCPDIYKNPVKFGATEVTVESETREGALAKVKKLVEAEYYHLSSVIEIPPGV